MPTLPDGTYLYWDEKEEDEEGYVFWFGSNSSDIRVFKTKDEPVFMLKDLMENKYVVCAECSGPHGKRPSLGPGPGEQPGTVGTAELASSVVQ